MHNYQEHTPNAFNNHEILRNYLRSYQGSLYIAGVNIQGKTYAGKKGLGNLLQPDFYSPILTVV